MKQPLAFRLRPQKVEEILGQDHLLGDGQVLARCLEEKQLFSMILFGPPGTGKTTLAMVLANELELPYRLFNAVTGNKKDLETIFEESRYYQGLVVIIDEVHRLNKDKQDLLLPYIENGSIFVIGATTSNPYFAINPAIRSRCHLFEIKALQADAIKQALKRALASPNGLDSRYKIEQDALQLIATYAGGDLRYALNVLEIAALGCQNHHITFDDIQRYAQHPNMHIASSGDDHYDAVSALQKSIRGSDVQAALYYLARLITAHDMDSIERRLLVIAYEEVGLANPAAASRTLEAIDAAKRVGFPEAMIPLACAVIDLSLSPKSRSACEAIHRATKEVHNRDHTVPIYLRLNAVGLKPQEKYDYDRPDLWPKIQYLPHAIRNAKYYHPNPTSNYEKQLAANYEALLKIARTANLTELKTKKD